MKTLKTLQINTEDRRNDENHPIWEMGLQTKKKKKTVVDYERDKNGAIVFRQGLPVATEFDTVEETIHPVYHNAVNMLIKHPKYANRIRFDAWTQNLEYLEKRYGEEPEEWEDVTDNLENEIVYWFGNHYRVSFGEKMVSRAIDQIGERQKIDSFREYMDSISEKYKINEEWINNARKDGATPLERMLEDYFGVVETKIARIYSKRFMIGALRRAYYGNQKNGIKHDGILILYGETGIGKSTAIKILCCFDEWYQDQGFKIGDKDAPQLFRGAFLYELKEMSNRSTPEREKQFYEQPVDTVRLPYERRAKRLPRRCSFVGTTNRTDILHDATGNRRYMPVMCGREIVNGEAQAWSDNRKMKTKELRDAVESLWAEAYYWMEKGELGYLTPAEEEIQATANEMFETVHPWTEQVARAAAAQMNDSKDPRVTVSKILEDLCIPMERRDHRARATVEMILTREKYRKGRRGVGKLRGWYPMPKPKEK